MDAQQRANIQGRERPLTAEQRANNDKVAACFAHIALLRKELQWISDTTKDPETKLQVHYVLRQSLAMPPQDPE